MRERAHVCTDSTQRQSHFNQCIVSVTSARLLAVRHSGRELEAVWKFRVRERKSWRKGDRKEWEAYKREIWWWRWCCWCGCECGGRCGCEAGCGRVWAAAEKHCDERGRRSREERESPRLGVCVGREESWRIFHKNKRENTQMDLILRLSPTAKRSH
jgi:hypothetical protein